MFKCYSQLFHDTASSSCVVGSYLSTHLSSAFIIVWTSPVYGCSWTYNSLCLSLPVRCLTPFVSQQCCSPVHTSESCRLCSQWRCAGFSGARMESAWAAWPLGVCVGVHWTLPSCSSTDACTACTSNVSTFKLHSAHLLTPGPLLLVRVRNFSYWVFSAFNK